MTKFPIEASIIPLLATEGSSNEGNNERALFRAGIQYHIPIYQRGYAWGYDDVRNFARSLFDKPEEAGGAEEAKHIFFGTVQFDGGFDDNPKKLDVVDGQQRLFTFALYLGMLQDLAEIENAPLNVFDNAPEGFKQAMNPSAPYKDGWYDVTRARAKRKYQDDKNDRFLKNKRLLYLLFAERFKG
ncbi:MAG: DUF262 domain-containing protein, partial [Fibrobacter sp.]|nr:DUF262 domain-containing protein [Fibrobacter sp.]